jgi:hypothetical protein
MEDTYFGGTGVSSGVGKLVGRHRARRSVPPPSAMVQPHEAEAHCSAALRGAALQELDLGDKAGRHTGRPLRSVLWGICSEAGG